MAYNRKFREHSEVTEFKSKETIAQVNEFPFANMPERGIKEETCKRFGVRMSVSEEDGKTPTAYYFPYYDQKGKLTGYKKRNLQLDKYDKYHFSAVGKVGVDSKLYGQVVAESINRKHNCVYLVEGEQDVMSVFQAMADQVKGTKYEGMEPFVVGLSCGTANAVEAVIHNEKFLKGFESITLAFDNDSATPAERLKKIKRGKECTEDVAGALMSDNLFVVEYPDEHKDASDMLQAGQSVSLAKLFQFGKRQYTAEKIVTAGSITLEELVQKREEGIYVKDFPKLMDKLHGFRTHELVVFTAPSNAGKSLVTSRFAYAFLEAGENVGMMMLEETTKETLQRMVAQRLKVNYNRFKDNPLKYATQEQIEDAYNWVTQERNLFLLDHFGSMSITELINKVKSFVFTNKVRYLLLDHLSMVISGSHIENERKELDIVLTELAAFCAANDVCIIAVSHLNRSIADGFKPPKGKENEPYWVPVTKEAMRGSASLEQLAWTVLGLEPQILPDKSRGNVRLTVLKNRGWGYLGIADEFNMDDDTGEFVLENAEAGF